MSIRRYPGFLLWLMLALPLTGAVQADDVLGERLRQLTEQGKPRIGDARLADVRVLEEFYQDRDYGFAWTGPARVEALERLAQGSRGDGLRASDFHLQEIHDLLKGRDPASLSGQLRADADILLSDSLLRLIHHYRYGKVDPQALDPTWNHAEGPYSTDLVRDLERAAEASDLAAEVRGLMPGAAFYSRLKKGLAHYREIAAAGGWKPVSPGRTLKPGMRDSRVPEFRERLRVTGDYSGPEVRDPRLFDAALKRGVMAFQKRHTLAVDGVVGPATLAAMNVSVENRIDQIRVNLERMRWVRQFVAKNESLVPSGQTTQFVVGAAGETDRDILRTTEALYNEIKLRRVYFSAFNPISHSPLEGLPATPPMREHRLYETDWLLRVYGFSPSETELALGKNGNLSLKKDPKFVIAQKQPWLFPVDLNRATYKELLRVPGIGPISAKRIVETRQEHSILSVQQLKKMRVATRRAVPFIWFKGMLDYEKQSSFLPELDNDTDEQVPSLETLG